MKRFFILFFVLLVLFLVRGTLVESFKELYYLKLSVSSKTKGIVLAMEENNSITGGLSYEYHTFYTVDKRKYKKPFLSSPESLGLHVGDSVWVAYSVQRPEISYLEASGFNWKGQFFNLAALFVIIIFLFDVLRSFLNKRGSANKKDIFLSRRT